MNRDKFVITDDMLLNTPSREDGCSADLEVDLRTAGCDQIQIAGQMLKIPRVATSTAQVLFQRFFCVRSFLKFSLLNVAMACIYLASKASENESLTVEIINAFHHLRKKLKPASKYLQDDLDASTFAELERVIHDNEFFILTDLGFCVEVDLPYQLLCDYLKKLNLAHHQGMTRLTWNYLNDSIRENVAVRYTPETLACASIKLAAHLLKVPLPETPPWWTKFGANLADMQAANIELMKLRARPRYFLKDLQKRLSEVKEKRRKLLESEAARPLHPPTSAVVRDETCHVPSIVTLVWPIRRQSHSDKQAPTDTTTVARPSVSNGIPPSKPFSILCRRHISLKTLNSEGLGHKTCHNSATEVASTICTVPHNSGILGRRSISSRPVQQEVPPASKRARTDEERAAATAVDTGSTVARTYIPGTQRCCKIALRRILPHTTAATTAGTVSTLSHSCTTLSERKFCKITLGRTYSCPLMATAVGTSSTADISCTALGKRKRCRIALGRILIPHPTLATAEGTGSTLDHSCTTLGKRKYCRISLSRILPQPQMKKRKTE